MKLEGDLRRSQRACQQLDTQKASLPPAFRLVVTCCGSRNDLPWVYISKSQTKHSKSDIPRLLLIKAFIYQVLIYDNWYNDDLFTAGTWIVWVIQEGLNNTFTFNYSLLIWVLITQGYYVWEFYSPEYLTNQNSQFSVSIQHLVSLSSEIMVEYHIFQVWMIFSFLLCFYFFILLVQNKMTSFKVSKVTFLSSLNRLLEAISHFSVFLWHFILNVCHA